VIILSLIAASISLPHLLKGLALPPEPSQQEDEDRARIAAAEAAIRAVERAQHDMGEGRSDADLYADALARKIDEIERKLRLAGLRADARSRKLADEMARKLVREIDLLEARFGAK
jgi:CPA1 family monovalent cation:H+ antiporter